MTSPTRYHHFIIDPGYLIHVPTKFKVIKEYQTKITYMDILIMAELSVSRRKFKKILFEGEYCLHLYITTQ